MKLLIGNKTKNSIISLMIASLVLNPLGLINECQLKFVGKMKNQKIKIKTVKQNNKDFYKNWVKPVKEIEIKEAKELAEKEKIRKLKQQKINEQKKEENQSSSKNENIEEITFTLTFYTGLEEENSYAGSINCKGSRLQDGMIANNVLPLGTRINLGKYGTKIVSDRGSNNFNTINRLDVFISREDGENDYEYSKRVNNMGRVSVKGYIIK